MKAQSARSSFDGENHDPAALKDAPSEVTRALLELYSDEALAGRLAHYEREALLERDDALRAAWRIEVARTNAEIRRRRALAAAEAERLFRR